MKNSCAMVLALSAAWALSAGGASANNAPGQFMSCAAFGAQSVALAPETAKHSQRLYFNFTVEAGDLITVSATDASLTYREPGAARILRMSDGARVAIEEPGVFRMGAGAMRGTDGGALTVSCAPGGAVLNEVSSSL